MDPMDQIRETFFQECEELMEVLEDGLNTMEAGEHDEETVNAVFRAAHSIKGGAGAFGLDSLVSFAHTFETTLDEVRSGRLEANAELMLLFLRAADRLRDLIADAQSGVDSDEAQSAEIIEELKAIAGLEQEVQASDFEFDAVPLDLDLGPGLPDLPDLGGGEEEWQVRFTPHSGMYERGNDCLLLIRALADLGDARVSGSMSDDVDWASFDPSQSYLTWQVMLPASVEEEAIREIFEFVEDDCQVDIQRVSIVDEAMDDADGWVLTDPTTAEIELPDMAVPPAVDEAEAVSAELNEDSSAENAESNEDAPGVPAPPAAQSKAVVPNKPKATIRVDLDRVDRLDQSDRRTGHQSVNAGARA